MLKVKAERPWLVWATLLATIFGFAGAAVFGRTAEHFAAVRVGEANIVEIDRAMRWGFNWELGPFEAWDAIGVEKSVAKLKEEGRQVPANVQNMLDAGTRSFYKKKDGKQFYYDFASEEYLPLADPPGTIILAVVDPGVGGERAAIVLEAD